MSCSLHDAARFEALGLPVVVLATDAFVRSADEQLAALNFGAYRPHVVFVPHPLASLRRDEVDIKADAAAEAVVRALTGGAVAAVPEVVGADAGAPLPPPRSFETPDDPVLHYPPTLFRPVVSPESAECET